MSKKNKVKKGGSRAYRIIYAIFAGIVSFIFNYKVINQDKEPDKGGCIVCANHVSATDAIALCYAFKKNQVYFMAKKELFKIPDADRGAEWHYLVSVVLMSQNRVNDAMRELEIACTMDPGNIEYQKAKEMFNNTANGYGSTYYGGAGGYNHRPRSSSDDACNCCANLLCMDCLCECMGGDLMPCI